ncbi:MAG: sulfotransferase [Pseudomonadales bacterium]|nr:sulfotransferase [Pseudomonadales bacterium]
MTDACPYLFVVGCPRSGTTLLQRMLDAHPLLAVANDTHFIPRAIDRVGLDPACTLNAGHVEFVRTYRRFSRLGVDAQDLARAATETTYQGFVAALYAAFAQRQGKRFAGEKTPDYVKRLDLLGNLFPLARFVHIIRDGREVAQSVRDWASAHKGPGKLRSWQESPIGIAALWWEHQVRTGRRLATQLGSRYLEVRYDQLVTDPQTMLRRIAGFLDLPYSERMAAFHEGRTVQATGLSAKSAWLPATRGLRAADDLSSSELALVETLTGELLDELGFARRIHRVDDTTRRRAERVRAAWTADMVAKAKRRAEQRSASN